MTKSFFGVSVCLTLAILGAGCASAPGLSVPTPAPFALPTLIPPTRVPPTATATLPPTPTPTSVPPTPTAAPTQEALATLAATATLATVTPSLVPTPTLVPPIPTAAIARGLYVTDLRIEPPPVRGVDLKFTALFLNGLGQEQNYRWEVYIFRADTQRQTGETSRTDLPIVSGTSEQPSNGSWKLPLGGPCDYFFAQVGWLNAENKIMWFSNPNGATFQKGFAVCPP